MKTYTRNPLCADAGIPAGLLWPSWGDGAAVPSQKSSGVQVLSVIFASSLRFDAFKLYTDFVLLWFSVTAEAWAQASFIEGTGCSRHWCKLGLDFLGYQSPKLNAKKQICPKPLKPFKQGLGYRRFPCHGNRDCYA